MRRVLLAALMCVAAWASGYRDTAAPPSFDGARHVAHIRSLDGHAGDPAPATDVWQSARAAVVVPGWRLDGHHADLPAAAPARASRLAITTPATPGRSPSARPHTFDLPLLI